MNTTNILIAGINIQLVSPQTIMCPGDLNAGGQFVKASDWPKIRLRPLRSEDGEPPVYRWLIPDHVDTTASNTLAAYDRFRVDKRPLDTAQARLGANNENLSLQDHSMR